jgi:hypothetical protein
MPSRAVKFFIFGSLYLALFAGVGYLAYRLLFFSYGTCFDNRQNQGESGVDCGGPCVSCEVKALRPIEVLGTELAAAGSGRTSVLISFKNPNTSHGAARFTYELTIFDAAGATLAVSERQSFLYAGEIRSVVEAGVPTGSGSAARATVSAEVTAWLPVASFPQPRVEVRNVRAAPGASDGTVTVSGILANREASRLSRVGIHVAIRDRTSPLLVGLSRTLLEDIGPFEERLFTATVPVNDFAAALAGDMVIFTEPQR